MKLEFPCQDYFYVDLGLDPEGLMLIDSFTARAESNIRLGLSKSLDLISGQDKLVRSCRW